MNAMSRDAARTYRRNAVMTAGPEKLVVLLYDGALRFIEEARSGFEEGRNPRAHEAVSRAFAVVSELRSSLDHEKGAPVSRDLERLYLFVQDRLLAANRGRDPRALAEAARVLGTVKEGWDAVVRPA